MSDERPGSADLEQFDREMRGILPERPWRVLTSPTTLVLALLATLITLLVFFDRHPELLDLSSSPSVPAAGEQRDLVAAEEISAFPSFLAFTAPGTGGDLDVFVMSLPGGVPLNITQSPHRSETLPAIAPDGQSIAFYSTNRDGTTDLLVWGGDGIVNLTYQGGGTGLGDAYCVLPTAPSRWSPDGFWIALLAGQCDGRGHAIELFVVSASGDALLRISDRGNQVQSVQWPDEHTLTYAEVQGDGTLALYSADLSLSPPATTELARFPRQ